LATGRDLRQIYGKFVTLVAALSIFAAGNLGAEEPKQPNEKSHKVAPDGAKTAPTPPQTPSKPVPKVVRTETLSFGNWVVNCAYTDQAEAKPTCSAILRIQEKVNNVPRVVFTWIMGEQKSKPISVLSMPTGVLIGPGAEVKIGSGAPKKYNYSLCAPDHCEAIIPMDASVVADMKRSETVEVSVVGISGQVVKFTVNMNGFDRAFAATAK
jgi:invasion protein IalB